MFNYDRDTLVNTLIKVSIVLIGLLSIFIFFTYIFPGLTNALPFIALLLMPFIIAWLISILTRPVVEFINRKLHIPRAIAVLLMLLLLFIVISLVMTLIVSRVAVEVAKLPEFIGSLDKYISQAFAYLQSIYARINLNAGEMAQLREWLINLSESALEVVTHGVGGAVNIIQSVPIALIFVIVTLVAIFFWCRDHEIIQRALVSIAPEKKRQKANAIYLAFSRIIAKYCRAQILLITISTFIAIVGYSILGVQGALSIGLLTGFLDILPVLGPGTLIIPWMIWSFISKDLFMGFGLLILYVTMTVSRNILEPKLVGDSLGLHPLAILAAIFIGLQLFGIWGIFIGPISLAVGAAFINSTKRVI